MLFEKRIQLFIGLSCTLFAMRIVRRGIALGQVTDKLREIIPAFRFDIRYRKGRIEAPWPNALRDQFYRCLCRYPPKQSRRLGLNSKLPRVCRSVCKDASEIGSLYGIVRTVS